MGTILQTIVVVIAMLVIPFLIGEGLVSFLRLPAGFFMELIYGWAFVLAVFEIIAIPVILLKGSLTVLIVCSGLCFLIALAAGIAVFVRQKDWKRFCRKPASGFFYGWDFYLVCALLLIAAQLVFTVLGMHTDADDAYYLGTPATSLSTNTLFLYEPDTGIPYTVLPVRYAFSALMLFWAFISKLSGLHPLIVAHTAAPIALILMAYLLLWNLGRLFFQKKSQASLFLLFLSIFQMFGFTSVYTQQSFFLLRIWQGKAMLPNLIFPLILYLFLNIYKETDVVRLWLTVFMAVTAGCCCSSMAVPLCLIEVGISTLILLMMRRKLSDLLYGIFCCLPCLAIGAGYLLLR